MNASVVYYSKTGNTRKIAEAIARAAGCTPCTVGEWDAETVADVLFIGGSLYGGKVAPQMEQFLRGLDRNKIRRAVLFNTGFSDDSIGVMKGILLNKGIVVEEESFSSAGRFLLFHMGRPNAKELSEAEAFAKRFLR